MENEIIKAESFGIEKSKATELTSGLQVTIDERKILINEFNDIKNIEVTEENIPKFKALRLKIVKNRTQGVNKWHKANKDFFLTGGRFVDAIKNKEVQINESMEVVLMNAEKHFENIEKERIAKLQSERVSLLSEFVEDASERDLSSMDEDVWISYLQTKKKSYEDKIQTELDAEKERQAKIKAEKEEQERIRKENEKLKKEAEIKEAARLKYEKEQKAKEAKIKAIADAKLKAEKEAREKEISDLKAKQDAKDKAEREERERLAKIEADKQAKIKADQDAKIREERNAKEKLENELKERQAEELRIKQEEESRVQAELNKGDSAKVRDLIKDLEDIKIKYQFKSAKNKKKYSDVGLLIDKVINHIEN